MMFNIRIFMVSKLLLLLLLVHIYIRRVIVISIYHTHGVIRENSLTITQFSFFGSLSSHQT